MKNQDKYVLQIGPEGQGGVNTMIESLINTTLKHKYMFMRIKTKKQEKKLSPYVNACIICFKMRKKTLIAHIHMASNGSYLRKSILIRFFSKYKIPIVLHLHGAKFREFYHGSSIKKQNKIKSIFAMASSIIVLTDDWLPFINSLEVTDKTVVVPNFTFIPNISNDEGINKQTGQKCTVLFMGRLGKRKGSYDLIDAISILKKRDAEINIEVILAGDGELVETQKYIVDKGLEDCISVIGWIDGHKRELLLKSADILALPSYFESFGLSLIEGMSYGLPVISTTAGSIPCVVQNGRDGFLVEAGDVAALADKLQILSKDSQLRAKMGKQGREHAIISYSEESFCSAINEIYEKLM